MNVKKELNIVLKDFVQIDFLQDEKFSDSWSQYFFNNVEIKKINHENKLFFTKEVIKFFSLKKHQKKLEALNTEFTLKKLKKKVLRLFSLRYCEFLSYKQFIHQIHMCQPTVGPQKIEMINKLFQKYSIEQINSYLKYRPVPFIKNLNNQYWIIDKHHLVKGLEISIATNERLNKEQEKIQVPFYFYKDYSQLTMNEFHQKMIANHFVYLKNGSMDITIDQIPQHPKDLEFDYYRGLAWLVKEKENIAKKEVAFAEFRWAEILRNYFESSKIIYSEEEKIKKAKDLILMHFE